MGDNLNPNQPAVQGNNPLGILSYTYDYIEIIQKGFTPPKTPRTLNALEWAEICCLLVNAIGRGFTQSIDKLGEDKVGDIITATADPTPLSPNHPTYFHKLTSAASLLADHITGNLINYQDEHPNLLEDY
ncbi:hypothetical protein F5148DRAFT_1282792 [Russula earlei]|uniref:Uncharacterized protein n=1 Tax=Russula earlei TaxID=71964 RepID=A0ACC0UDE4_9AGAM|nr:hypothetical protein F5148DRAFT_1282792 [Russula earlei]